MLQGFCDSGGPQLTERDLGTGGIFACMRDLLCLPLGAPEYWLDTTYLGRLGIFRGM